MRKSVICGLSLSLLAVISLAVMLTAATGDTRVSEAAMNGDRDVVRSLLKQAADVNAAQGDGMTALHWAALKGDAEMTDLLLYAGANVKATTRMGGYTPLYFAAKAGSAPVIGKLLNAGADPKAAVSLGLTPLHMAAASGDAESVKLLLDKGADPNAVESEHGQTPLSFAAAMNRADVIKVLVDKGAKVNLASKVITPPAPAQRGLPAAGAQAAAGQAAAPAPAAAGGRGAAQAAGGGRGGRGAAAPAAAAGAPTAAASAATPAPAAAGGGRGGRGGAAPAAGAAAANGQPVDPAAAAAQQAQNNGQDGSGRGGNNNKGGLTPLMYAARQGNMEAAVALLNSSAKIDEVSADKSTALLLATINAHFDFAKMLIERGANPNIASVDGATPLYGVVNTQWARHSFYPQPTPKYEKTSYLDLMKLMLDKGASIDAKLAKDLWYSEYNFSLESASSAGTTAFWKCAEVGDIEGMKFLVSRGADPKNTNITGVTALLMASGAGVHGNDDVTAPPGRMAAVKYLVEVLHLDVNAADTAPAGGGGRGIGGGNPQQLALQQATQANGGKEPTQAQIDEQLKIVQAQQAQGGRAGGGVTALHNAAARGDNEMILYLVSKGAKVDVVAGDGSTVADKANGPRQRIQPYPETVALLEMLGSKNNHKCVSC